MTTRRFLRLFARSLAELLGWRDLSSVLRTPCAFCDPPELAATAERVQL